VPSSRWAARTLDIDLLLHGDEVVETATLTVPHLRMAFRRFVLEPAAEVAPKMIHPIIGWPIERLLLHLNAAKDEVVLISPSESLRTEIATALMNQVGAQAVDRPTFKTADQLWPPEYSTWLSVGPAVKRSSPVSARSAGLTYAAAAFPKLSILLDADDDKARAVKSEWSRIIRQPGRGPSLRLRAAGQADARLEVFAAIESVWFDLGPANANRLE
jgi:hypothetical protein